MDSLPDISSEDQLNQMVLCMQEEPNLLEDWTALARCLNIPEVMIRKQRQNLLLLTYQFSDVLFNILHTWLAVNGGQAPLKGLCDALESLHLRNTSESLRNMFSTRPQNSTSTSKSHRASPKSLQRHTPSPLPVLTQSHSQTNVDISGMRIGKGTVVLFEDQILGEGSNGSVFKGLFGPRKVAIKTITVKPTEAKHVEGEIKILLACDDHENIVKYYGEEKEVFSYANSVTYFIAIELCHTTLKEWIEKREESKMKLGITPQKPVNITAIEILRQVTKGLEHLHERAEPIIHRDLKPENILLLQMTNGQVRVKLTDFGISRVIPEGQTHATLKTSSGTLGWMAPEVFNLRYNPNALTKMTKETDIFSLGCVFYYVLTNGQRPFSISDSSSGFADYEAETDFTQFASISYYNYSRLIRLMMLVKPKERPSIRTVANHHIFWSTEKILQFLSDSSKNCDAEEWNLMETWLKGNYTRLADSRLSKLGEIYTEAINSEGWLQFLSPNVKANILSKIRNVSKYKGHSVRELVRAIRNLREHFNQLNKSVQDELENSTESFLMYWTHRFPFLVDLVWTAALKENMYADKLRNYYEGVDCGYDFAIISARE